MVGDHLNTHRIAWDLSMGLSLLFAARVFKSDRQQTTIRVSMILSSALCVTGILSLALGDY